MTIVPFEFESHEVRTIVIDGEPWFVAKDVARALGYVNVADAISKHCKGVANRYPLPTAGGTQQVRIISEPDVLRLIVSSKLPTAEAFERLVFEDILPTIRKTGRYGVAELTRADLARMVLEAEAEKEAIAVERDTARAELKAVEPKRVFADAVAASDGTILVGELAKILRGNGIPVGQNRLFQWLRDFGYLIRRQGSDWNMPTQRSMELGLFQIKETAVTHSDGHVSISKTPKVTGKGQQYFINAFLKEAA